MTSALHSYLFIFVFIEFNWYYIIYFMSCHFTWAQICKCNFLLLILDFYITILYYYYYYLFVCLFEERKLTRGELNSETSVTVCKLLLPTQYVAPSETKYFPTSLAVHLISYWRRKQKRVLRKRKERVYIARHSRDTTRALVVWSS